METEAGYKVRPADQFRDFLAHSMIEPDKPKPF